MSPGVSCSAAASARSVQTIAGASALGSPSPAIQRAAKEAMTKCRRKPAGLVAVDHFPKAVETDDFGDDPGFLGEFAQCRRLERLARLDDAAGQ